MVIGVAARPWSSCERGARARRVPAAHRSLPYLEVSPTKTARRGEGEWGGGGAERTVETRVRTEGGNERERGGEHREREGRGVDDGGVSFHPAEPERPTRPPA